MAIKLADFRGLVVREELRKSGRFRAKPEADKTNLTERVLILTEIVSHGLEQD